MNTQNDSKALSIAYGIAGSTIEVPQDAHVVEPRFLPGLADEAAAIRHALRNPIGSPPLRSLLQRGASVGISVCDVTRPFPGRRVLPVILEELSSLQATVTLFIATGTHRLCTEEELGRMLGGDVIQACRLVQHDAFDPSRHAQRGTVPGTDVAALIEAEFLEQDVRITTGFIEPHFFAGFSGGPKMVTPGLAALETVLELHSAARIASPHATWGITEGNPVHDAIRALAARAHIAFNLDVTLNRDHAITNVFAGELYASHRAGCEYARRTAMAETDGYFDVVVTTNGGYPLDQNLYQSVKGMSAAAEIVRPGGSIVVVSECSDGLPNHGLYKELLQRAGNPENFLVMLDTPGFSCHDQWQVQKQALIQRKAHVYLKADGLAPSDIRAAWLTPIDDVSATVTELLRDAGPHSRLAVLPQGPMTIPYVRST